MGEARYTRIFDDVAENGWRKTPDGMAHWSGTGPDGTKCYQCSHLDTSRGYYAASGQKGGKLLPGRCKKYIQLGGTKKSYGIPAETRSCKYFDKSHKPTPLFKPKGVL